MLTKDFLIWQSLLYKVTMFESLGNSTFLAKYLEALPREAFFGTVTMCTLNLKFKKCFSTFCRDSFPLKHKKKHLACLVATCYHGLNDHLAPVSLIQNPQAAEGLFAVGRSISVTWHLVLASWLVQPTRRQKWHDSYHASIYFSE